MTDIHESLKPLSVSIDSLTPDPSNARKHDKRNIEAVKASLARFGQTKPIVLHANGSTIIAGNGTWYAAKELGWTHIAAAKTSLDTAEAVAYGIADNKTAELAEWEDDTLRDLMDALPDDLKLATGFEGDEIAEMLRLPSDEVHEDEVPPTPKEPTTQPGDLWLLGDHRVLCGDSTNPDDIAKLMQGDTADMMFTDPPYGVDYDGGHFHSGDVNIKRSREKLQDDESTDIYFAFLPFALSVVDGPCYMWHADNKARDVLNAVHDNECEVHAAIVWHKTNATYAAMSAQYKPRHEPCLYFKPKGSTLRWCGATTEATVWNQDRDGINDFHPTQKPVALAAKAIGNHDATIILDAFLGSGSTLIAADQLDRKCYGMELEPNYCDVIVKRWENLTGKRAERVPAEVGDASTVGS
jgi:site-specific DNA-methyltransferase (adenine-specific)